MPHFFYQLTLNNPFFNQPSVLDYAPFNLQSFCLVNRLSNSTPVHTWLLFADSPFRTWKSRLQVQLPKAKGIAIHKLLGGDAD